MRVHIRDLNFQSIYAMESKYPKALSASADIAVQIASSDGLASMFGEVTLTKEETERLRRLVTDIAKRVEERYLDHIEAIS